MAFIDMKSELADAIPSMSRIYAGRLINRAWRVVQDSCLWSFQLGQGGFSTPPITTAGSITATLNSNLITGDAAASAVWTALGFSQSPTRQQIRANGYSIYSIIAIDFTVPTAVVLTLDRPFIDPLPSYTSINYQMFGAYIAAPPRFKRWLNVADMFNCYALDFWTPRRLINQTDPARLYTSNPYILCGLGQDQRPGSSTLGQQLFELWPNPATAISYMTYYVAEAPALVNNFDTLPHPITQEIVLQKAREYAYEWAEARRDVMAAKGSGANYGMLKKEARAEFDSRLKTLRLLDREAVDSYNSGMNATMSGFGMMPFFNPISSRASMGLGACR